LKHFIFHAAVPPANDAYAVLSLPKRKPQQLGDRCDVAFGRANHDYNAVDAMRDFFNAREEVGEILTPESFLFPVRTVDGILVPSHTK
jgi:hypothetical protein